MTNWATLQKTSRRHGDFAGRSDAEQDAYFAAFAGSDGGRLAGLRAGLEACLGKLRDLWSGRSMGNELALGRPSLREHGRSR